MKPDDETLAASMRDSGKPDSGKPELPVTTQEGLEKMQAVMRRMHRRDQVVLDREIAEARPGRDKDDWRFTKLRSDLMYFRNRDEFFGRRRPSSESRAARAALNSHVDFMNTAYGLGLEYPELIKVGDPIVGGATPVHQIPTGREVLPPPQAVVGAGRLMTPEEEGF